MLRFRTATLEAIHEHARETYPEECCGFVLVDAEGDEEEETVCRIANTQNQMHERDPTRFQRDAKRAYFMNPGELLAVYREVEESEWNIKAVYHSHPDRDAVFSPEDKRLALFDGRPLSSDWIHVIVSVYDGQVRATRAFEWDEEEREFVEVRMASLQRDSHKGKKTIGS